jgi:hypothetical protein
VLVPRAFRHVDPFACVQPNKPSRHTKGRVRPPVLGRGDPPTTSVQPTDRRRARAANPLAAESLIHEPKKRSRETKGRVRPQASDAEAVSLLHGDGAHDEQSDLSSPTDELSMRRSNAPKLLAPELPMIHGVLPLHEDIDLVAARSLIGEQDAYHGV